MTKKPSQAHKLPKYEDFGLPSSMRLRQTGVIGAAISKIIAQDEAVEKFHRKMLCNGLCSRYEFAFAISNDEKAFANFVKDDRIQALSRPPKDASDTLRCLFQVTYPDPKKASKYFKRIESLWNQECSPAEVLAFLEKNGVSKPSPSALPPSPKAGPREVPMKAKPVAALKVSDGRNEDRVHAPAKNEGDTPCGTIYFWPGKLKVGEVYDLRVHILNADGEMANFDLHDVSTPSA